MTDTHSILVALAVLCAGSAFGADRALAVNFWFSSVDPTVVTNNDCGVVSSLLGRATIRRGFMAAGDASLEANVADRVQAGDELEAPSGGFLEFTSGNNIVAVIGSGSKVKLLGVRNSVGAAGTPVSRLDMQLLAGEMRIQVRLNEDRPEAVLVGTNGGEVLVTRGDTGIFSGNGWMATSLAGQATARQRRGDIAGAPFAIAEGRAAGVDGEKAVDASQRAAMKSRLAFSFEQMRAALPPRPGLGLNQEAP